jgi:NADH:ubiquinone oxidoreductase subunit 6 (subunit J)
MLEAINWHSFFFLLFALAACGFAIAVVVSANIVRMAFYLVVSLAAVAGLFFLAGADFLGAVQLMVYVGGTLVLLVFGVMLTARGPLVSLRTGGGQWVMAALVGGALAAVLLHAIWSVEHWAGGDVRQAAGQLEESPPTAAPLGMALLGIRTDRLGPAAANPRANAGMCGYLLVFEIISVHLLVVLVGAAYLARAKHGRREISPAEGAGQAPPLRNATLPPLRDLTTDH